MTAKEMWEALGCEIRDEEELLQYTKGYFDDWIVDITFRKKEKEIYSPLGIDMKTLKAIYQQCKELGWINDR